MKFFATAALGLVGLASAHMEMKDPPPFRSKFNEFTTDVDYSMTNPLSREGGDFPCKGYNNLVGTPQGQSVATWAPGSSQSMTITGGTPHGGGSCQASLSYDGGSTWTVIHSYLGNCPVQGDSSYEFTLPNDTPAGEALFAWTWFNQIGNREMYMNCAVVTIGGGSAKRDELAVRGPDDPFASRPAMFVANVGNGCSTVEGSDLEFPNPGPDVTNVSQKTAPPTGSCPAGDAPAGDAPAPETPDTPEEEPAPVVSEAPEAPEEQPPATSIPGGVFITVSAVPSTLQTVTKPAPTATEAPEPEQPEQPEQPDAGTFESGTACENEGEWNCVGGTKFQRCASGLWSVLQDVYPGTKCAPGVSADMLITRDKTPARNYAQVLRASRELAEKANRKN